MSLLENEIRSRYEKLFGDEPLLIRSPGRINLIGEHTDYNDGFVMPAAIDKEIIFAIGLSRNDESCVYALRYNEQFSIDMHNPKPVSEPGWANFLLGIIFQLKDQGHQLRSFNCVFGGDVPLGAGLSSSAALECGFAFALNELFKLKIDRLSIVKMGQWAEHHFVGVKCGIMDQFASVMGKKDHVIVLDCRDLSYDYSPLKLDGYDVVLCDSKVKHSLVDSEYNKRRSECEDGVRILQHHYPGIKSLRDVSLDILKKHQTEFSEKVFDRCRYVVEEIARVQEASQDLKAGKLESFGKKMFETHQGLSTLYEVSCVELDFLVEEAKNSGFVLGARMMGGGFGGCTINIVKHENLETFTNHLSKVYKQKFDIELPTYVVHVKDGTSILSHSPSII